MFPVSEVYAAATGATTWANCSVDGVPTFSCLEILFGNIFFMAASFIVLALFVMFVVGGFTYLTSFGNPEKVKKAQMTLKFAIIGFALYLSSFLILKTIDVMFLGNCGRVFQFQVDGGVSGCPNP